MNRTQWVAVIALLLLALLVGFLFLHGRQPPYLPADEDHARFLGHAACDACHGPDADLPRGPNHPLGNDCMRCHAFP